MPLYRQVVEETLDYVLREMTSPEGPFYSTQDADSEGEEGKFFVWSAQEIEQVLGKERADVFAYVYDVTPEGNWEGHNILHRTGETNRMPACSAYRKRSCAACWTKASASSSPCAASACGRDATRRC